MSISNFILKILLLLSVKRQENEYHHRERQQRRPAVTQHRQRNPDHRHEADGHPDVDEKVHEQAGRHAVTVDSGERLPALLSVSHQPVYQEDIQQNQSQTPQETPLFADCAEDEVRALLRHEPVCRLGAVEETLAGQSTGADGNHRLPHIISHS